MANSLARIGWGGGLKLGDVATPTAVVAIDEIRSMGVPQDAADEHDVTHLKSAGRRKEFIAGLIDGGEVEVSLNYVPESTTNTRLAALVAAGTVVSMEFNIPNQAGSPSGAGSWKITTTGFVKGYHADSVEPNAPITATLTLRVTGAQAGAVGTMADDPEADEESGSTARRRSKAEPEAVAA